MPRLKTIKNALTASSLPRAAHIKVSVHLFSSKSFGNAFKEKKKNTMKAVTEVKCFSLRNVLVRFCSEAVGREVHIN